MLQRSPFELRLSFVPLLGALVVVASTQAGAFPGTLDDWQNRYGAVSASGDDAGCQLCHAEANGGSPWNAYGWDIRDALQDLGCDLNGDGVVSNDEAFFCVEPVNSDGDTGSYDNLAETGFNTQPGWTLGANTLYDRAGPIPNQPPPANVGPLDPDGTEPVPPELPEPPIDPGPPGRPRFVQVVSPGDSLQRAVDRAKPGGWIFVEPGIYRELSDPTNGLEISKPLNLIGLSAAVDDDDDGHRRGRKGFSDGDDDRGRWRGRRGFSDDDDDGWHRRGRKGFPDDDDDDGHRRVVLENAGNQRNGIVVVPEDRQDCMGCHSDMGPPFPLHPGVEGGLKMREPMIYGFKIKGITIRGFRNNGLFTENVDGFEIVDVESIDNRNYGIFPTLSKNGLITRSKAVGSDLDSGIWVETSENVTVTHNLVAGNVNGFEVSNSDDILLAHNESRNNTVGAAILLLPDIFDDRPGAKRIDLKHNWIHDNNKPNTARPGSVLSFVPSGTGVLFLGVDESEISRNLIANNDFSGVAIADYCLTVVGTPFACGADPSVTPEFVADQTATDNWVAQNTLVDNGTNPDPDSPFAPAAADLTFVTLAPNGNCYEDNVFTTFFALIGVLPPCP